MGQDEEEACVGYLTVILQQDVYTEGRCDRLETGGDDELQAHQGQAHEAQCDGEVDQEPPPRLHPRPGQDERGDGHRQVHEDLKRPSNYPLRSLA